MEAARHAAIEAALSDPFSDGDLTARGTPLLTAINARMPSGAAPVTAAERDEVLATMYVKVDGQTLADQLVHAADLANAEPPAEVRIRLVASDTDPLRMTVNGALICEMRAGEEATVPATALPAIRAAATIIILE